MTDPKLEIDGVSIVLLGSFNPKIFQPAWFAAEGLIRAEEGQSAEVKVIHPQIASFISEWLGVEVTEERAVFNTTQASCFETLRDLVVGTFRLLRHTPIQKLGLNRDQHFRMPSTEEWHQLGDRLAPKQPWTGLLEKPGMRTIIMEGVRTDGLRGSVRIRIEPSVRVIPDGVYIGFNDHYESQDAEPAQGSDSVVKVLESSWADFVARSEKTAPAILGASA